MTQEEILTESKNCYDNCKLIIQGLGELTKSIESTFDITNAQKTFDMLLQSLLFSQALVDADFCKEEKDFIENLAKDNNLFDFTEIDVLKGLTWQKVFEMELDKQQELADAVNEALNTYADEFVLPFAVLDAATTQNSLLDLSAQLTNLSVLLGAIDGQITEEEVIAFQEYADDLIVGKWADIKGLTEIVLEEGADAAEYEAAMREEENQ